jgi:hypothetical protein
MTCRVTRFSCAQDGYPWRAPSITYYTGYIFMRDDSKKSEAREVRISRRYYIYRIYL